MNHQSCVKMGKYNLKAQIRDDNKIFRDRKQHKIKLFNFITYPKNYVFDYKDLKGER